MKEKKRIFKEPNQHLGFWTMWYSIFSGVLVAGTLTGVIIALLQLNSISETSKAEFILKFKEDFFKKESRDLMENIDENKLKFIEIDSIGFFQLKKKNSDTVISAYEIDENLLNHFEDIGMFERRGILSLSMVSEMFGWYITDCWENAEIQKYIKYERDLFGITMFQDFEYIYKKCKEVEIQNNVPAVKKK